MSLQHYEMFKKCLAITVWLLLIKFIGKGSGQLQSPCPDVFQYVRNEETGSTEGRIEIRGVPNTFSLHTVLELSVATALPTKYVGKLRLEESKDLAAQAIQQGRPLIYRVEFPVQHPLPLVTRILFNNMGYCSGRRAIGSFVTMIVLEHTFYPFGVVPDTPDPSTTQVTKSTSTPKPKPVISLVPIRDWNPVSPKNESALPTEGLPATPTESSVSNENPAIPEICGRSSKIDVRINLLVAKGEITEPGDWPWLVAIFLSRVNLEFRCAGSLISSRHVLTAAHCMRSKEGRKLPASTLLAVLGRYKLRNWAERGSVTHEVSEYRLHPEYVQHGATYEYDLTVMTLVETVTFGSLILPICLWSGPSEIERIVGKTGFVVGWGRDELGNPVTAEPRMASVPIVSQEECLRSNADFVQITSNRTFCGGSRDGSGPCNGDSGGGLVMWDAQARRYYLRGIVSLSLFDRELGACDLSQFIVYTDIAKYINWIQEQIAT